VAVAIDPHSSLNVGLGFGLQFSGVEPSRYRSPHVVPKLSRRTSTFSRFDGRRGFSIDCNVLIEVKLFDFESPLDLLVELSQLTPSNFKGGPSFLQPNGLSRSSNLL